MPVASNGQRTPEGTIPAPPDGYARPYRLGHPWLLLFVAGSFLGVGALLAGLSLSPVFGSGAAGDRVSLASLGLVFALGVLGTVLTHELLHGLGYRYYGYDVSFSAQPLRGTFTTAARGQLHTRQEAVRIALAPVCLLTPVSLALVAAPVQELSLIGLLALVVNTSGSIADLHLVWRLRSVPLKTLLCDANATYVYEPRDPSQHEDEDQRADQKQDSAVEDEADDEGDNLERQHDQPDRQHDQPLECPEDACNHTLTSVGLR